MSSIEIVDKENRTKTFPLGFKIAPDTLLPIRTETPSQTPEKEPRALASGYGIFTRDLDQRSKPRQPSDEYLRIMRRHFVGLILNALDQVEPHCGSTSAALYINQVLNGTKEMENKSPDDPFLRILYAFFDALAFKDRWIDFTADQYNVARRILSHYSEQIHLRTGDIAKAIIKLEEAGFDTIPFELDEPEEAYREDG